jgi:hypothetical protein
MRKKWSRKQLENRKDWLRSLMEHLSGNLVLGANSVDYFIGNEIYNECCLFERKINNLIEQLAEAEE